MNVLMDLDGTLTDPAQGICASLRHALVALNRNCPEDAFLKRYIGPPLHETFADLLGSKDAKEIADAIALYRERFGVKGLYENTLYPDIPAALRALSAAGATLYLATAKPRIFANKILQHFRLSEHFKAVYGSELDGTRTNKADLIAHLLKTESITAMSACMVGDRSHDVVGAKANGVRMIGALWGYGTREELIAAGATTLCERPALLPDAVSG